MLDKISNFSVKPKQYCVADAIVLSDFQESLETMGYLASICNLFQENLIKIVYFR